MSRDNAGQEQDATMPMDLASVIRSVRERRRMTMTAFAHALGVAQSVVSRYESGERTPRWRTVVKVFLMAEGAEKDFLLSTLSAIRGSHVTEIGRAHV